MDSSNETKAGFIAQAGRHSKALKIIKIIEDAGKKRNPALRMLDIGTGNGEIAHHLSQHFDVTSVDIVDQRQKREGFSFIKANGEQLPFANQSFDVVVSNHVIEHIANADHHLAEIARILKPDGLAYLATPNRNWPWEVHYHVSLLHYLPQQVFMRILKYSGKYQEELKLLTWSSLKYKAQRYFFVSCVSDVVCKWPRQYYFNVSDNTAHLLSQVPLWIYRVFTFIHPTLILILKPKQTNHNASIALR